MKNIYGDKSKTKNVVDFAEPNEERLLPIRQSINNINSLNDEEMVNLRQVEIGNDNDDLVIINNKLQENIIDDQIDGIISNNNLKDLAIIF